MLLGPAFRSWNTTGVQWHLVELIPIHYLPAPEHSTHMQYMQHSLIPVITVRFSSAYSCQYFKNSKCSSVLYCQETTRMAELRTLTAVWEILGVLPQGGYEIVLMSMRHLKAVIL